MLRYFFPRVARSARCGCFVTVFESIFQKLLYAFARVKSSHCKEMSYKSYIFMHSIPDSPLSYIQYTYKCAADGGLRGLFCRGGGCLEIVFCTGCATQTHRPPSSRWGGMVCFARKANISSAPPLVGGPVWCAFRLLRFHFVCVLPIFFHSAFESVPA